MLFAVKNRLIPTLATLTLFVSVALTARSAWDLPWHLHPYPTLPAYLLLALAAMLACDGAVYGLLCRLFGDRYQACQRTLAAFFAPQAPREMIAGGLLAAGEELLFRGVVLEALVGRAGLSPVAAIGISAALFGALHFLRDPLLAPFAPWAIGQGVILGSLYVTSGSLLLVMLVHAAHDTLGFLLLARQRRDSRATKGKPGGEGEVSEHG
jgi:membrane protease YdiL (CAAX protease family)